MTNSEKLKELAEQIRDLSAQLITCGIQLAKGGFHDKEGLAEFRAINKKSQAASTEYVNLIRRMAKQKLSGEDEYRET